MLGSPPHSQNDRYWAPANHNEMLYCKKAHNEKSKLGMPWLKDDIFQWCDSMVDSVNGDVYSNQVLKKKTVQAAVRNMNTRRQYWFMQDGASCHFTTPCLDFFKEFHKNTVSHRPAYSVDLLPLNCSFWNLVTVDVTERQLSTLENLQVMVEDIALRMYEDLLQKIAGHIRKSAAL